MRYLYFLFLFTVFLLSSPARSEGFLASGDIPNSLDFLPPPPPEGSPDWLRDQGIYQETGKGRETARWKLAIFDADYDLNASAGRWFERSFGLVVSQKETPETFALISGLFKDLSKAVQSAKKHYMRVRPFVYFDAWGSTCGTSYEKELEHNGAYPSGHSAKGWGMALVLAEISPERQASVLKRGYEIGQSRVVCGVHWQSDVEAGRLVASAVVVRLHDNENFSVLLKRAKKEIKALRKKKDGSVLFEKMKDIQEKVL